MIILYEILNHTHKQTKNTFIINLSKHDTTRYKYQKKLISKFSMWPKFVDAPFWFMASMIFKERIYPKMFS